MKPPVTDHSQSDLFRPRISEIINPKNPIKRLGDQIDWAFFEKEFGQHYTAGPGYPPCPIRLMVGLLMLQHIHDLSDEKVVKTWVENLYWQSFCGYDHACWEEPIDPSSLTRFRNRLQKEGVTKILQYTIQEAVKQKVIRVKDLKKVVIDTTVMEKNITYPTDSSLLNKARKKLVAMCKEWDVPLRQNYERLAKYLVLKAGRYAHAQQFKRMNRCVKKLKTFLGRVVRDTKRKIKCQVNLEEKFKNILATAEKILIQEKKSKNKIYSIHEPHVYCVAKGKAHKRYEYGSKVSIVTTQNKGLVLCADALEKNKHDSRTLAPSLAKAEELSGHQITQVLTDKGYRGHKVTGKDIYVSGQRRGMTRYMKRQMRKRSGIEAHISHMKNDGKLSRNYLKGVSGDMMNALLCGMGHNLRCLIRHNYLIIPQIWALYMLFWQLLFGLSLGRR